MPATVHALPKGSMNQIGVSLETGWTISSNFVKVPVEVLASGELSATAKTLWMVLANQANFRPISKSQIDIALGVHRGTRLRLLKELRDLGLIKGEDHHLILVDPRPILRRMEKQREEAHALLAKTVYKDDPDSFGPVEPKEPKEKPDYFGAATDAWNSYRPRDYAKVRKLSTGLLQALDAHLKALKVEPHNYEAFFSVLKAGVERSKFWSQDNNSKTLQSLIGFGAPTSKKFNNVYTLYNDGLDAPSASPVSEDQRQDSVLLPKACRKLIDDYDEAQYHFYDCYFKPDCPTEYAARFLIDKEQALVNAGLDPAKFRFMHHSADRVQWPTNTPAPSKPREIFWSYKEDHE